MFCTFNVNTLNLTCEMIVLFYQVGCYLNTFTVAGIGWGQALMHYFRKGSRDQKGWETLIYMDPITSASEMFLLSFLNA